MLHWLAHLWHVVMTLWSQQMLSDLVQLVCSARTWPSRILRGLAKKLIVVTAASAHFALRDDASYMLCTKLHHLCNMSGVAGLILSMSSTSSAAATV